MPGRRLAGASYEYAIKGEQLLDPRRAIVAIRCLEVQPQQGFGIGGTQVEPPVTAIDGEAVDEVADRLAFFEPYETTGTRSLLFSRRR